MVIIGFGHLGNTALKLWKNPPPCFAISRSTTSTENKKTILINTDLKTTSLPSQNEKIQIAFNTSHWINFWMPPRLATSTGEDYLTILTDVLSLIRPNQLFTFTSSTSVFGAKQQIIEETTIPEPDSVSGNLLLKAEHLIQNRLKNFHIIRLAGLMAKNRHPIFSLQGKKNLEAADHAVNLIHMDDAVGFIYHLYLHKKLRTQNIITNLASHTHLPKKIFYQNAAKLRNLSIPEYQDPVSPTDFKTITTDHLWKRYHYSLKYLHVN